MQRELEPAEHTAAGTHIQELEGRASWEVIAHRLQLRSGAGGTLVTSDARVASGAGMRIMQEIDNNGAVSDWNKGGRHWTAGNSLRGELFAAIMADFQWGIELRAYHLPGTIIIKLRHDAASRMMRAGAVRLEHCAFHVASERRADVSAADLWAALQAYPTPRPSPLVPTEEIRKTKRDAHQPGPPLLRMRRTAAAVQRAMQSEAEEESESEDGRYARHGVSYVTSVRTR